MTTAGLLVNGDAKVGSETPTAVARTTISYWEDLSTPIIYFVLCKILPIPRDQKIYI